MCQPTKITTFLATLVAASLFGACAPAPEPPRNLLLLTLDTLRADRLGHYGYARDTSPHLDALAAVSTVFEDATCSIPSTLPSHLTILTGLTPAQHGVTRNGVRMPRDLTSIFERLDPLGLRSAAVVAVSMIRPKRHRGLGLGEIFFPKEHAVGRQVAGRFITDQGLSWLEEHGEEPFALWLHYFDTHEPYSPPKEKVQRLTQPYDGPLPAVLETPWLVGLKDPEEAARLSPADQRYISDLYDAEVAVLDDAIGRVLDYLRQTGLWRNTAIVVVGDHGQALGENGFYGHGDRLLEPIIKVPMLIRLPGQRTGQRISTPVETTDLVPTLLDLFGVEPCADCGGRSLLPALEGQAMQPTPYRVVERRSLGTEEEERGLSLLGRGWKLTYVRQGETERFHLGRTDGPGGLDGQDQFQSDAPEVQRFAPLARALLDREVDTSPIPDDAVEELRALGYLG